MSATSERWWRVPAALVAIKMLVHLALIGRYDYHGDELYFIECSKHLAFGYVDHPPVVPWLAWVAGAFDHAIWALRLPSVLAGGATVWMTALLVREWKGGAWAQLVAGMGILLAPAYLRMHSMLDIPAIEVLIWTSCTYLVARILTRGDQRLWLAVGLLAGIGLLTKHSMGLWGVGLAVGLLLTPERRLLRARWPWIGGSLALLVFLPNVIWQFEHDWATAEFLGNMRRTLAAMIPKPLFLAGQVLYMHPLSLPIWVVGLWSFFREQGRSRRALVWIYLTPLLVLLIIGGKPYYLAPAYPLLFAAGGIALEAFFAERRKARGVYLSVYGLTGAGFALCVLPLLPVQTIDGAIDALLGWAVPPQALTHDLHAEFGWQTHARSIRDVHDSLPAEEQERVSLLTGNYSSASALRFFDADLPPATTGHLSYHFWGPEAGDIVIAWGLSETWLREHFEVVDERGRIVAPLARPHDSELAIHVCREPTTSADQRWSALRNFDNSGSHGSVRIDTSALREDAPPDRGPR